jgi:hypothetical protein
MIPALPRRHKSAAAGRICGLTQVSASQDLRSRLHPGSSGVYYNRLVAPTSRLCLRVPAELQHIDHKLETKVGYMKTFSLDEAQSLLPILESLLRRAIDAKASAGLVEVELQMLSRNIFLSGGMLVDVAAVGRKRVAQRASVQQAQDAIQEIDSIGVQVKDLDKGLLDFPYQAGEQIVLLCWQLGEAKIDYWHTVEAGFQGRQPLDERFIKARPERPN